MLELGFPRALLISTLTLAATFAAGAAHADPPAPPTLPAASVPADAPPPARAAPAAAPSPPRPMPQWSGPPPGFELGYGSPSPTQAVPFEQQPEYPPEMRMRSAGFVAGGVVLLSFGMVGLFAGSAMVGAHEPTSTTPNTCIDCNFDGSGGSSSNVSSVVLKPGFQTAGIITLVGSAVAIVAAIPLIVIGAKKVPYADASSPAAKAASLTPSLRVAAGSATVVWQF